MKKLYTIILCASLCACGGGNKQQTSATDEKTIPQPTPVPENTWYDGEIPIIFDAYKDYPITDIKLSELADAEYIALETTDKSVLRLIGTCKGNEYLLTDDHIYLEDRQEEATAFFENVFTFAVKSEDIHEKGEERTLWFPQMADNGLYLGLLEGAALRVVIQRTELLYKQRTELEPTVEGLHGTTLFKHSANLRN